MKNKNFKELFLLEFIKAMEKQGFEIKEIHTEKEIKNKSKKRN